MNERQRLYIQEPYYRIGYCRIEIFKDLKSLEAERSHFIQLVGSKTRDCPGTRTYTKKELAMVNL